jgi:hypothetical protein
VAGGGEETLGVMDLPSTNVYEILAQRAAADEAADEERRRATSYDPVAERRARRKMMLALEQRVMNRLGKLKRAPTADDVKRAIKEEARRGKRR